MNTESICLPCKSKGVEPVVTSALHQTCGNPMKAVLFFCCKCCSVHDQVDLGEMPPYPVPWKVWHSMQKFPPNAARFYAVRLTLKLWKLSLTNSRWARVAAQTASHENIVKMELPFFENGTEQRSMSLYELGREPTRPVLGV